MKPCSARRVHSLHWRAVVRRRPQGVREPAVAGAFYPADPKELATMVDGFLAKAQPPQIQDVVALVAPHAGYPYSGQVAAYSYALLKGRKISRVVVIAPSHYEAFGFTSVYDGSAYTTPLGKVPVDKAFCAKLASAGGTIKLSGHGHTVTPDKRGACARGAAAVPAAHAGPVRAGAHRDGRPEL